MTKNCAIPRCADPAAGYSTLCAHHKQVQGRHGHPEQDGVTVHQLAPYVRRVEARKAKNKDSNAWALLAARWHAVVEQSLSVVSAFASGRPMVIHEVQAAEQVSALAGSVPDDKVVSAAVGMFLMLDAEPRRFRSDRAFNFQLVRRVRGLTRANAGSYCDNATKRTRLVYRDLPPRAAEVLAAALTDAFGLPGRLLAEKERAEAANVTQERQRLADALEALQ